MDFDPRDIRQAMDVYTADNVYLGTVLRTSGVSQRPELHPASMLGGVEDPQQLDGEMLGPASTQRLGNRGPQTQTSRTRYASAPDSAQTLVPGTIEVGKWWGLLGRRRISMDYVQTVSMERVILRLADSDIP